jgi:hypothetical protein
LTDWYIDKKSAPWFFPSLNKNFSKISEDDWGTTPFDTNLNESDHPLTKKFTGDNLSVLEAVEGYV